MESNYKFYLDSQDPISGKIKFSEAVINDSCDLLLHEIEILSYVRDVVKNLDFSENLDNQCQILIKSLNSTQKCLLDFGSQMKELIQSLTNEVIQVTFTDSIIKS